ncbi:MAG: putative bifunctional diguanylate cyclase/phosphodiesterase [Candidatus Dormibacteria bacterium]
MSSAAPRVRRAPPIFLKATGGAPLALWVVYAVMGALLTAYIVSLLVRPTGATWPWADDWGVGIYEVIVAGLLLARGFTRRHGRAIPLVLGTAVLLWSLGDLVLAGETWGGSDAAHPSLADAFYVGFYPLAYVAIVLMLRRGIGRLLPATWLDGAIAGLGAAAVCAAFAFHAVLRSLGGDAAGVNPFGVAVDLVYPIGDVLLLALVVGGTAILPGRRTPWLLFATACAVNGVGDTFNLFGSTAQVGIVFNGIAWPIAITLMSISVWLPPGRRDLVESRKLPGFVLPGAGAVAGLVIMLIGAVAHNVGQVAVGLATATLVVVGVRLALSVHGLRALTEERHRQAVTDELTGLGNRRQLTAVLDAYFDDLAEPATPTRTMAFLFVDLDHFKEINDSFGHSAGDELLKQLGPRLRSSLRASDVLVRIGGDELGAVLIDSDPVYAAGLARRLTALLEQPFILNGVSVRIRASIGIATAPADAGDSIGLMRCADVAMYRAKMSHQSYEVYTASIDDGGNRLALVEELRAAVESERLVLHYQPQVDLRNGEIVAAEALVRWSHPRLGLIPPLEFLPLAEEAGLMGPLTRVVLEQALAQCATWRGAGSRIAMSVNVSSSNLLDPGFTELVRAALRHHRLPASAVILEITETTIIRDFAACQGVIEELRALGVGVSIDDFGSGFTSLAYLGSLPITELKLDRTFVGGLSVSGREQDIKLVRATIELGHALGLLVVAEGIETLATLELLALLGCDRAQGYFTGRPVAAQEFEAAPTLPALRVAPRDGAAIVPNYLRTAV